MTIDFFLLVGKRLRNFFLAGNISTSMCFILHSILNLLESQRPHMIIKFKVFQAMSHWLLVCLARENTTRGDARKMTLACVGNFRAYSCCCLLDGSFDG